MCARARSPRVLAPRCCRADWKLRPRRHDELVLQIVSTLPPNPSDRPPMTSRRRRGAAAPATPIERIAHELVDLVVHRLDPVALLGATAAWRPVGCHTFDFFRRFRASGLVVRRQCRSKEQRIRSASLASTLGWRWISVWKCSFCVSGCSQKQSKCIVHGTLYPLWHCISSTRRVSPLQMALPQRLHLERPLGSRSAMASQGSLARACTAPGLSAGSPSAKRLMLRCDISLKPRTSLDAIDEFTTCCLGATHSRDQLIKDPPTCPVRARRAGVRTSAGMRVYLR